MSNSKINLEGLEDNYLMKKVQEGDFSKMGILFDRHQGALFGYFYRMTNDASQSEDLLQNVFYRLLKYRHTFKHEGKFIYWMYAVARNVSMDLFRKKDPMKFSDDLTEMKIEPMDENNRETEMEYSEKTEELRQAMAKLDPEKREAIVLSKFQGMKYQDIAAIANVSENAIKARVRRGLMELRSLLEEKEA